MVPLARIDPAPVVVVAQACLANSLFEKKLPMHCINPPKRRKDEGIACPRPSPKKLQPPCKAANGGGRNRISSAAQAQKKITSHAQPLKATASKKRKLQTIFFQKPRPISAASAGVVSSASTAPCVDQTWNKPQAPPTKRTASTTGPSSTRTPAPSITVREGVNCDSRLQRDVAPCLTIKAKDLQTPVDLTGPTMRLQCSLASAVEQQKQLQMIAENLLKRLERLDEYGFFSAPVKELVDLRTWNDYKVFLFGWMQFFVFWAIQRLDARATGIF